MNNLKYLILEDSREYDEKKKHYSDKNYNIVDLDAKSINDDNDIFFVFAKSLKFPQYFGKNWNAFYDCITDLLWLENKNTVIFIKNTSFLSSKDFFETFIHCLIDAKRFWKKENVEFHSILFIPCEDEPNKKIISTLERIEKNVMKTHE